MDFKDQIKQLSERVVKLKDNIQTEEATKTAFIMPMIRRNCPKYGQSWHCWNELTKTMPKR